MNDDAAAVADADWGNDLVTRRLWNAKPYHRKKSSCGELQRRSLVSPTHVPFLPPRIQKNIRRMWSKRKRSFIPRCWHPEMKGQAYIGDMLMKHPSKTLV